MLIESVWIWRKMQKWAKCRQSVSKCTPEDLFTFCKSVTSYWENNQNILVCWLYSCIYHSQTWILVFRLKINIYNVKQWRRFISKSTATVHCWRLMGWFFNCSGVLKHSAATEKINVLTTSRTTTYRHNDELRNMFFKNNPGKIATLKNYN